MNLIERWNEAATPNAAGNHNGGGFARDHWEEIRAALVAGYHSFDPPEQVAGMFEISHGGVFVNADGDYLIEPVGDETGELILIRADGSSATLRGDWETGWTA